MKLNKLLALIAVAAIFVACDNGTKTDAANTADTENVDGNAAQTDSKLSGTLNINSEASYVHWTAAKLLSAGHHGNITVSEGSIAVDNGNITGGSFTFDLNSLVVLDEDMEDDKKAYLTSHLMGTQGDETANDFFNVNKYPTAQFVVKSVKEGSETSHIVVGDLTIKDVTKQVEVPFNVNMTENALTATGSVSIDRTEWGIVYNSKGFFENVADNYAIRDDVKLELNIEASL
ncbi:MAG: YceI family protein [Bacteroidetes bacterium]|nr:YceI family protein [Bacteroidota bacterium]